MPTVSQIFQQNGLPQWWNTNGVTNFFNGLSEKGTDFGTGGHAGEPIGSLSSGRVVYVGNGGYQGSSIGQIVQVLMPGGNLIHYQHLMDSTVHVGQSISPGQVVGHSGGCATYGPGGNCASLDQFSTGPHIEVRMASSYNSSQGVWQQAWFNPLSTFQQLAGGQASMANVSATGGAPTGSTAQGQSPFTAQTGGVTNAPAATACAPFDIACALGNFWSLYLLPFFEHMLLLVVALVLIVIGFFLLGGNKIIEQAGKGAAVAA